MIQADNIAYQSAGKPLLDQVSVQIPSGQITAILGPNGAGKSTLLKCLTGILAVTAGTVSINHQAISAYSVDALSRLRAVLSQAVQVNFPFTALEIVQMGRSPYRQDGNSLQPDISRLALEVVDAWHLQDRLFPTLSGGEQQRVHLARVLAQIWHSKDCYLFLDEPTSALDLKHQHQVMTHLKTMAQTQNTGICIVMHDLHLAQRYADRVIIMKEGQLYAAGETANIVTATCIEEVFEVDAAMVFS